MFLMLCGCVHGTLFQRHLLQTDVDFDRIQTCVDAGYNYDWCVSKYFQCRNDGGNRVTCETYYLDYLDEILPPEVSVTVDGKTQTFPTVPEPEPQDTMGTVAGYVSGLLGFIF